MALMELALNGYAVILLTVGAFAIASAVRRMRGLFDVSWGLMLIIAAAACAGRVSELTSRHCVALALLAFWVCGYTLAARRALAETVIVNGRWSVRIWLLQFAELCLALSPILVILADPHDADLAWGESLALALAIGGYLLVAFGTRAEAWLRRDPVVTGYALSFAALYVLAIGSPTGALTIFAPLLVARRCEHVLSNRLSAPKASGTEPLGADNLLESRE